jgi:hypothetical protein
MPTAEYRPLRLDRDSARTGEQLHKAEGEGGCGTPPRVAVHWAETSVAVKRLWRMVRSMSQVQTATAAEVGGGDEQVAGGQVLCYVVFRQFGSNNSFLIA